MVLDHKPICHKITSQSTQIYSTTNHITTQHTNMKSIQMYTPDNYISLTQKAKRIKTTFPSPNSSTNNSTPQRVLTTKTSKTVTFTMKNNPMISKFKIHKRCYFPHRIHILNDSNTNITCAIRSSDPHVPLSSVTQIDRSENTQQPLLPTQQQPLLQQPQQLHQQQQTQEEELNRLKKCMERVSIKNLIH